MATPGARSVERSVRLPRHLLAPMAVAGLGAGGLAAAVLDRSGAWLLLAGAVLAVSGLVVAVAGRPWDGWSPLGYQTAPRVLVAGGCAAILTRSGADSSAALAVWLAVSLQVGGVVAEPMLARLSRVRTPVVAHLPGVADTPEPRRFDRLVPAASLAALATGVLTGALSLSPWLWTAVALVAAAPSALALWWVRQRMDQSRRYRAAVERGVAAYAPVFAVHTAWPQDGSHQVSMWLPYLKRAGLPFVVVARYEATARAVAELTEVPVIQATRGVDLEVLLPPSLTTVFYVNASSGNGELVRFHHLAHVFLGHGDSDKPTSYNPIHAMYDTIFAAGPAAVQRYADHGVLIDQRKFRVVGRPQVESVRQAAQSISATAGPVVLYAPTWRGHVAETRLSSLAVGEQIITALLRRGATVVFRPHPFSYDDAADTAIIRGIQARLAADAASSGRRHLWAAAAEQDRGIIDCMNESTAMIADVSGVTSDYLFSEKPLAMVAMSGDPDRFALDYPVARAAYVLRRDLTNLEDQLDLLLGDDPLARTRADIRVEYLGDAPVDGYADTFVQAVREVTASTGGLRYDIDEADDRAASTAAASTVIRGSSVPGVRTGWLRWRNPVLELAGTATALVALAAVLWPALLPVAVALALVAVVLGLGEQWAGRVREREQFEAGAVARAVALVLATLLLLRVGAADDLSVAVVIGSALLLAVGIAVESFVIVAWTEPGLDAHDLPDTESVTVERVPRWLPPRVGWGCLAVAVVLSTGLGSSWWLALPVAAYAGLLADAARRGTTRMGRAARAEQRLPAVLTEYAPQFAVYFASTIGAAYQVGMWLPYFVRLGVPFVIVTRTSAVLQELARVTAAQQVAIPIVHRPTLSSLQDVIVPSMTAAFYVNNAVRNTHLVERRELTHVWLNHGDSEKPACYNPVHAIYDRIFSAGQAGIDRYARHGVAIPREKFEIVGRPQVEVITKARAPIAQIDSPTVLYAPTWRGPFADSRVFSLPLGPDIVAALLERGATVIFRAHPFNYRFPEAVALIDSIGAQLKRDRARTGRQHRWGAAAEQELTVEECFNASDAMISDVSAVVSDYLQADKPFSIVSVGRTPAQLADDAPAARAAYVLREDLANLTEVLDRLLVTDDLAPERTRTRVYYLGDFAPENYADGFLRAAHAVMGDRP